MKIQTENTDRKFLRNPNLNEGLKLTHYVCDLLFFDVENAMDLWIINIT